MSKRVREKLTQRPRGYSVYKNMEIGLLLHNDRNGRRVRREEEEEEEKERERKRKKRGRGEIIGRGGGEEREVEKSREGRRGIITEEGG